VDQELEQATPETQEAPQAPASSGTSLELGRGLDVGTANLVSAGQDVDGNVCIKIQRNAFIDIDSDDYTRNMLTKLGVQYVVLDNRMVVLGDPAFELANIFTVGLHRAKDHRYNLIILAVVRGCDTA